MDTYVVGFNIFDVRGLVTPDQQPCDPFVVVECCDKEYQTETKIGKQSIVTYNENFIWSDIKLYREQFKAAYITFSVYARNFFTRNDLIGRGCLQLENIRNRRHHVYAKKWITLTKENSPAATGAILLTCFCLQPGDSAPSVDQQEGNDDEVEGGGAGEGGEGAEDYEDLNKAVLGGTIDQSGGKPHHLMVTIHRVEDLADGSNPFVTSEFAGSLVTTSSAKNVQQHTFNECLLIPVMTPLFEDIIVVKLWNNYVFSADDILAQGMLSFSELRNRPMHPRWFNFYGYNPDEIQSDEVKLISEQGEQMAPNFYMGKLLISARVEKLPTIDELCEAGVMPAARFEEPSSVRVCLLSDVYMVAGAVGRECQVEITLGTHVVQTDWVYPVVDPNAQQSKAIAQAAKASQLASSSFSSGEIQTQEFEMPNVFQYDQKGGRPGVISSLSPEDAISQPDCLVNVYTRGVMSGRVRLGYARLKLKDIQNYEPGNPRIPTFFPLVPMPWNGVQKLPVSLLMTLEKTSDESATNNRHNRKQVKNMLYVLRAYIFAAKDIAFSDHQEEPNFFARVTCAGASVETHLLSGDLRPMWMRCLELNITLMSDHPKKSPTMEPITVSVLHKDSLFSSTTLGKAICKYTYMRNRNLLNEWEPYSLDPQWVRLFGGQYNTKSTGSICVAFELLRKKDASQLPPSSMWPKEELLYRPSLDFCRLKKATLHISLLGLRDMKPLSGLLLSSDVTNPMVEFRVRKLMQKNYHQKDASGTHHSMPTHSYWKCRFKYIPLKKEGDPNNPEDRNKNWDSGRGTNFEFLQYGRVNLVLPELPVFQPWVSVHAYNNNGATAIADCRLPLGPRLPWLQHAGEWHVAEVRDEFTEENEQDRELKLQHIKQAEMSQKAGGAGGGGGAMSQTVIKGPTKTEEELDTTAVPLSLRKGRQTNNLEPFPNREATLNMKLGHSHGRLSKQDSMLQSQKQKMKSILSMTPAAAVNNILQKQEENVSNYYIHAVGEIPRGAQGGGGGTRQECEGRLEDNNDSSKFPNDLHYRGIPLTRNRDVVTDTDMEPSFDPGVYGFIKCCIKLTEGHMEEINAVNDNDNCSSSSSISCAAAGAVAATLDDGTVNHSNIPTAVRDAYGTGQRVTAAARVVENALEGAVKDGIHKIEENVEKGIISAIGSSSSTASGSGADSGTSGGSRRVSPSDDKNLKDATSAGGGGQNGNNPQEAQEADYDGDIDHSALGPDSPNRGGGQGRVSIVSAGSSQNVDPASGRRQSMDVPKDLDEYAWSEEEFREKYKSTQNLPSRVRVRLYFVKGICIYGKGTGFANPYLEFNLGKAVLVSMRNLFQTNTNTPSFYRLEERDIRMPEDSRLEISLKDYQDFGYDGNIGSTVVDLEDRWHSKNWQDLSEKLMVPSENRGLWNTDALGMSRGSIEMWIELLDSVKSSEQKASALRAPPVQEIEVRIVVWDTYQVRIVDGDHTDVTLSLCLDCAEYGGGRNIQDTDVHFGSKDGYAIFNWRVVYSNIKMPTKSAVLQIKVNDYNSFSGPTFIGDVNLDLKKYLEKVSRDMDALTLTSTLNFKNQAYEDENPDVEHVGQVNISMWVLTQSEADAAPVGYARNEPNVNPQLITPLEGRGWGDVVGTFTFSLPDFGLLGKVMPIIIVCFLLLIGLRYIGLL